MFARRAPPQMFEVSDPQFEGQRLPEVDETQKLRNRAYERNGDGVHRIKSGNDPAILARNLDMWRKSEPGVWTLLISKDGTSGDIIALRETTESDGGSNTIRVM